nr:phospholipase A1-Igamma2, chloroplastic-like [Ipomoea batatas]
MATITSQINLWLKKGSTQGTLLAKKALPLHRFMEGSSFLGLTRNGGPTGNLKCRFQLARTIIKTLHGFEKAAEDQNPTERRLADSWEEIHGENNWVGLLEPFDSLLRTELIRYGDMAQACYDAYEEDPSSRFGHRIKIEPHVFFKSLGLTKYGYDAEDGFLDIYTKSDESNTFCNKSARTQVTEEVQRLLHEYSGEKLSISVTGHSLGSALATINAYDIAETRQDKGEIPVCVFSFSGPRVGNLRFKQRMEELGVKVLRVANIHDAVPKVPGVLLNERLPGFMQKGERREFLRATRRNLALVNKSADLLNDALQIPPKWREALRKKADNITD